MTEHSELVPGEIELYQPKATVTAEAWTVMREQASVLIKSGFLPHAVNTPEKAISIMMKGRELGVPPMYALSNIAVINGKPTAGAELMLALIYRDHGDEAVRVVESTAERCTVTYRRRGWEKAESFSFTLDDAQRAGLLGKDNWRHYPAAMLRARCISAVARLAFPDTIGGLYTPEELGAAVAVDERGEAYLVEAEPATARKPGDQGRAARSQQGRTAPARPEQLATIAKLSSLLGEPVERDGDLDEASAAELIRDLSRRYNELDRDERSRRSRRLARAG